MKPSDKSALINDGSSCMKPIYTNGFKSYCEFQNGGYMKAQRRRQVLSRKSTKIIQAIQLKDKRGSYYLRVNCFSAVRMLSVIVYRGSAGKPEDAKHIQLLSTLNNVGDFLSLSCTMTRKDKFIGLFEQLALSDASFIRRKVEVSSSILTSIFNIVSH